MTNLDKLITDINTKCVSIEKHFIDKGLFSVENKSTKQFILSEVVYTDTKKSLLITVDLQCMVVSVQEDLRDKGTIEKVPTWLLEKITLELKDYLIYFLENTIKMTMTQKYCIKTDMLDVKEDWFKKIIEM